MKHPVQDYPDPGIQTGSSDKQDGAVSGIPVSEAVWQGIEAVRRSGLTNMLDRNRVAQLAGKLKHPEAKRWVKDNPRKYSEGVFLGFIIEPQGEKA